MRPVPRVAERKFFASLSNVFSGIINRFRNGTLNAENATAGIKELFKGPISRRVDQVVSNMVKTERDQSVQSWKEAVLKNTYGREMYAALMREMKGPVGERVMELIAENSKYIKSVPQEWAAYVVAYTKQETQKGRRPEDIEADLRKIMPEKIAKNLKCIARTECAKANAALTQARSENLGIKAYIWRSCHDERTRHSHSSMDGVLVFYDDPPNPEALFPGKGQSSYGNYHAGNTFNCRCYQEPVVDIKYLPDSVLLHYHGKVAYWSKSQIKKKFGKIA